MFVKERYLRGFILYRVAQGLVMWARILGGYIKHGALKNVIAVGSSDSTTQASI